MYKLKLFCFVLLLPFTSCTAGESGHCLDKGYVCLNQEEFVDSVVVYLPERKEMKVYLLTEKHSSEDKRRYARKAKTVHRVSGTLEIDFKDVSSRNVEKLDIDVRVDKQWRKKNGVTGIYISARQDSTDSNLSVKVEGDLKDGAKVHVLTSGRKQSYNHPIDVDWRIDVQSEVIVGE